MSTKDKGICKDFLSGICPRPEDNCKWKHPEELRKEKPSVCKDYQNKFCDRQYCKFLHFTIEEEENYVTNKVIPGHKGRAEKVRELMINQPHGHHNDKGYGMDVQQNAWGTADLPPPCKNFLNNRCERGKNCRFRHATERELALENELAGRQRTREMAAREQVGPYFEDRGPLPERSFVEQRPPLRNDLRQAWDNEPREFRPSAQELARDAEIAERAHAGSRIPRNPDVGSHRYDNYTDKTATVNITSNPAHVGGMYSTNAFGGGLAASGGGEPSEYQRLPAPPALPVPEFKIAHTDSFGNSNYADPNALHAKRRRLEDSGMSTDNMELVREENGVLKRKIADLQQQVSNLREMGDENEGLKRKLSDFQKQILDLREINDTLYAQNNKYRNQLLSGT